MKVLEPEVKKAKKSSAKIQLERLERNSIHKLPIYLLIALNVIVLCLAGMAAQQILFAPQNPVPVSVELGPITQELNDIKRAVSELKGAEKQSYEFHQKEEQWKKMSERYHVRLLADEIRKKIIFGEEFSQELAEMKKFSLSEEDANYQILSQYTAEKRVQIKALIANLYDVKSMADKQVSSQGFIESIKHFFSGLFVVQKVEGEKIHATSNEIISLTVQLLLEGKIESAYIVANKFRQVNGNITTLADNLKPARDALIAIDKLSVIYD